MLPEQQAKRMNGPQYTSQLIAVLIAVLIPVAAVSQDPVPDPQAASQSGDLSFGGATDASRNCGNSVMRVVTAAADFRPTLFAQTRPAFTGGLYWSLKSRLL